MKGKVKNILKYSLITACIFVTIVLAYTTIAGYLLINDAERIDDSTGVFKEYGELFEKKLEGFTGNARIIEEGKGIYIMTFSRQAHLATELLFIMLVGMIVGAGIGYVNAVEDISKANVKKMFVMYGIGVIILMVISYLYMNGTNVIEPEDILPAIIASSPPVLIYSLIYILSILYKIIDNRKKKDVLNELLKDCKSK